MNTCSPVKEAAFALPYRRNVGNLHDTGHSTESTPTSAMADDPELSFRQVPE
jgi:hypothetical protein